MCTAEAFSRLQGALLPFADQGGVQQPASSLLHQVLLKASADKRFIAEEVRLCSPHRLCTPCRACAVQACLPSSRYCDGLVGDDASCGPDLVDALQAQRVTAAIAKGLSAQALPMLLPYMAHKNPKVGGGHALL